MDATKRPLRIPPEFLLYAEKHEIFDLYKRLLERLIVDKPEDPITYLIDVLKKDNDDIPAVLILGPPSAGKFTVGKMVAGRLRCPHLTMKGIVQEADRECRAKVEKLISEGSPIPSTLWVTMVKQRLSLYDCNRKGWVLSGYPQTREQALLLQAAGVMAKHVIFLDALDDVLIERAQGKRIDPETGDIYHLNFDPPSDEDVTGRLQEVAGNSEEELVGRLKEFHSNIHDLLRCFTAVTKTINADQPMADVFGQSIEFVSSIARSIAPRTPRVILVGPPGAGKDTQAALLASKYNMVNLNCGHLVRQEIVDETKLGAAMRTYVDKKMAVPDALLLQLLKNRMSHINCVTRGWVLHGYPRTREQAEQLAAAGFAANRVFFLDVPNHAVMERLANRQVDNVTGERYHSVYHPAPATEKLQARLKQHPRDSEDEVQRRLSRYHAYYEELNDFYTTGQTVPADQDSHTVFEMIESFLVNPIPKKYH